MNFLIDIISLMILFAGIGIILNLLRIFYFYTFTIKKWGKIDGVILKSEVVYFRSDTDSETEGWKQEILYRYCVDEIWYESNIIGKNIGILLPSKTWVERNKSEIKVGEVIQVFYNPKNPSKSVIEDKFNYSSIFVVLISFLAFCFFNVLRNL
jgi:hypothetical protein